MYMPFVAVLAMLLGSTQTTPSDKTEVMARVRQFVEAFNKGDTKAAAAACAEQISIIDEFPPYDWHGAGACLAWMNDYDANAKKSGIKDGAVTLRDPRHLEVTGDRAYVVIPAAYRYTQRGKTITETGSAFTLVLRRSTGGWRITSWAWGKN